VPQRHPSPGETTEASQAQGHQRWLESRQTFLGQVRAPIVGTVRPVHGLRGSGSGETSGERRRPYTPRSDALRGQARRPRPSSLPFFLPPTVFSSSPKCVSLLRGSSCAGQPLLRDLHLQSAQSHCCCSTPQARQSPAQFVPFRPADLLSVLLYPSFVSFPFYHCETRYIADNIEN